MRLDLLLGSARGRLGSTCISLCGLIGVILALSLPFMLLACFLVLRLAYVLLIRPMRLERMWNLPPFMLCVLHFFRHTFYNSVYISPKCSAAGIQRCSSVPTDMPLFKEQKRVR